MSDPVLSVRNLATEFSVSSGTVRAVDDVSFDLRAGETLGIVGESGSGKSVTALSLMRLIREPVGRVVSGQAILSGRDLLGMSERELARVRGKDISIVFQDPMTSLNPVLTIGYQIAETMRLHRPGLSRKQAKDLSVDLLASVGVPDPKRRLGAYPHQFSGGMRQRVMIAIAIANRPSVLIADEPSTALDATIQAQLLDLLRDIQAEFGIAMILITHDFRLIAEMADRVLVMYAGRVLENGLVGDVFSTPRNPYTAGLMKSIPTMEARRGDLALIPGQPPDLRHPLPGCSFEPRCYLRSERCQTEKPSLLEVGRRDHLSRCHHADLVELSSSNVGGSS
jgi:oligopeptide/dipeptide ABC transporter ATP-binding protein